MGIELSPVIISIQSDELDNIKSANSEIYSEGLVPAALNQSVDSNSNQVPLSGPRFTIDQNYDNFYLNPDLESLLNRRGFSTQRAEILGMFNYVAPLAKGTPSETTTEAPYLITPAGELYDYQCQLKQMRYNDALSFFETLGFSVTNSSSGVSKLLSSPRNGDTQFTTWDQRVGMLKAWTDQMGLAEDVLDYLAAVYNAISRFIEAQDLSGRYKVWRSYSGGAMIRNVLTGDMSNPYDGGWKEYGPNEQYLRETLPILDTVNLTCLPHFDNEDSFSINEFIKNMTTGNPWDGELIRNSGTCTLLNLLSFIGSSIVGTELTSGYITAVMGEYQTGQLVGTNNWALTTPDLLSNVVRVKDISGSDDDLLEVTNLEGVKWSNTAIRDMLDDVSKVNFGGGTVNASDSAFFSDISYLVGLDTIQSNRIKSGTTKVSMSEGESPQSYVKKWLGRDVQNNMGSILNNLPESYSNITRTVLTKDNDQTISSNRNAIETFTQTNARLASSTSSSRTGRSYYCDEIPTLEYDESVSRLTELKDSLGDHGEYLNSAASLLYADSKSHLYLDGYFQYGYLKGEESKIVPSTFYQYAIRSLRDSILHTLEESRAEMDSGGLDRYSHLLSHIVAGLVSEDLEWEYLIAAYNLAWYDYKQGEMTKDEWKDLCFSIEYKLFERMQADLFEAYDAGEIDGDGHCIWYGNGSTPDVGYERPNLYDGSTWSSDLALSPSYSEGYTIDQENGNGGLRAGADKEDIQNILDIFGEMLWKWGGDDTLVAPKNVLLAPYHTWRKWETDVRGAVENTSSTSKSFAKSCRNFDDRNKILTAFALQKSHYNRIFKASIYFQTETSSTTYKVSRKNDKTINTTFFRGLFAWNKRSLVSFVNAVDIFQQSNAINKIAIPGEGKYEYYDIWIDPITLKDQDGTNLSDIEEFGVYSGESSWWGIGWMTGYGVDIKHFINKFKKIQEYSVRREKEAQSALYLSACATDQLYKSASELFEIVNQSNMLGSAYVEVLEKIRTDPDFQKASLLAITRSQLQLNRAIYDSFSSPNREYPYLPATKAIMTNQSKNMSGLFQLAPMLQTPGDARRFIAPIGIPAGMLEALRTRMMDETGDTTYRYSDIAEVAVWKRNLLHSNIVYEPKRYVFDVSKFIIEGRSAPTIQGGNTLDAARTALDPINFENLLSRVVTRGYTPDGNSMTVTGKIHPWDYWSEDHGVDSNTVFKNHIVDSYLKLFMQLTTGFDFHEDIFPFLEGEVFFDGVDFEQEDLYKKLEKHAQHLFVDRDIESALNYQRLLGEIRRSRMMSPKKYRNRIVYPKVFDRVFCVLIDPLSFKLADMSPRPGIGPDHVGKFTQYYCTVSIKPSLTSTAYEISETSVNPPEDPLSMEMYVSENFGGYDFNINKLF